MAEKTIRQRIALEGGDEVKERLEAIGKAGREAFEKLKEAVKDTTSATSGISGAINDIRKDFAKFRAEAAKVGAAVGDVGSSMAGVVRNVGMFAAAITGAIYGVVSLVKSTGDLIDRQAELAESAGVTNEAFGRLAYAFAFDTVDAEKLRGGLAKLSKAMFEARSGSGEQADAFAALGVSITDAAGNYKNAEQVLIEISDVFAKSTDDTLKLGAGAKLFGKSVADLVPTLNKGGAALRELGLEAERLGIVFTKSQAATVSGMMDAFDKVGTAITGIRSQLTLMFAPALTTSANAFVEALVKIRPRLEEIGAVLLTKVQPILNDFVTLIGGGALAADSGLGQLVGVFNTIATAATVAFTAISLVFQVISAGLDKVLTPLRLLFGEGFNGDVILATALILKMVGAFRVLATVIALVKVVYLAFLAATLPAWGAVALAILAAIVVLGVLTVTFEKLGGVAARAWEGTLEWFKYWYTTIDEFITYLADSIREFIDKNMARITAAWEATKQYFNEWVAWIKAGYDDVINTIIGLWDSLGAKVQAVIDFINNLITATIQKAKDAANAIMAMMGAGSGGGGDSGSSDSGDGFAGGGYVRGRGTSRSDSIAAWLSNGEFVQRAAAVRKYGAHFMHQINNLQFPARGFADGGLALLGGAGIGYNTPAAPSSGQSSSGRPVNLTIGGETFAGLIAPDAVAEKLIRFATNQQSRLIGRKPAWYGSR